MKLFEVFGEIALQGQEAVEAGLAAADSKAAELGANLEALGGRVSAVGDGMTKWVTGPILAVGAGVLALGVKLGDTADRLLDLSDITGLSTDAIQEWQHVAKMAGVDTEAMTRATQLLNRQMAAIEKGSGPAAEAVEKLGWEMAEFVALPADRRMEAIIERLRAIPDPMERARIGTELFGRQWENMAPIIGMGAAALDEAREAGRRYALERDDLEKANEFRQAMEELKAEFGLVVNELTIKLLPVLLQFAGFTKDTLVPALGSLFDLLGLLLDGFNALPGPVQRLIGLAVTFVAVLGPLLSIAGRLIAVFGRMLPAVTGVATAFAGKGVAVAAAAAAMAPLLVVAAKVIAVIAIITAAITAVIAVYRNWDKITAAVRRTLEALVNWAPAAWGRMKDRIVADVRAVAQAVVDMPARIRAGLGAAWDQFKQWGARVVDLFRQLPRMILAAITSMVTGVVQRVRDMVTNTLNALKNLYKMAVGNSIIPDMVSEIGQEMQKMVKDGTKSAQDFATGVSAGLAETSGPGAQDGAAYAGGPGSGAGMVVDLRHAIIRDDLDMLSRARRAGADLSGAYA